MDKGINGGTQPQQQQQEEEINLVELAKVLLRYWMWYGVAIVVALCLGVLYILSTPKQYERSASVLIKDNTDQGTKSVTNALANFGDFASMGVGGSVDNELLIFKSNTLLTEVVQRLKLNVTYKTRQMLRKVDLYGKTPFEVKLLDVSPEQQVELKAQLTADGNSVVVREVRTWTGGEEIALKGWKAALNDTITTELGQVVIAPTNFLGNEEVKFNELTVRHNGLKNTVLGYAAGLQIVLADKKATIINISLKDESRQRAEDLINTLIDVYNEEAVNDKNLMAMSSSDFINERLIIIEQELSGVDSEIEKFKKTERLTDIKSEADAYVKETSLFKEKNLSLENQLNLAQYIKDYLTDPANRGKLIPANTGVNDANTESVIGEYNTMLLKRDRLLKNSSEKNPVVLDLNNALFAMEQNIVRVIDNLIAGLRLQIGNLKARELQIERRIEAVPSQQKYVLSVARQQKIKEELYLFLLNKREENALKQAITQSNARVVDSARGSDIPVAPRTMVVLAGCVMLGLILPTGVILLVVFMDNKVRSKKDIEDLGMTYLGDIPEQPGKRTSTMADLTVTAHGRDAVAEAFRIIRTNINFIAQSAGEPLKVLTFTSLSPNSGKSFVTVNLAMSLAFTGKRVVVVDLDVRKGQLSKRLGLGMKPGITTYISKGKHDVKAIIQPSNANENLFFVPVGPIPPNPAELLLSDRLDDLVNELKEQFDFVLIDNVPAGIVADAVITNRFVDMTVYVMRAGVLNKSELPMIVDLYKTGKFKNMVTVLNSVKKSKRNSSYGYGYGYTYGYE